MTIDLRPSQPIPHQQSLGLWHWRLLTPQRQLWKNFRLFLGHQFLWPLLQQKVFGPHQRVLPEGEHLLLIQRTSLPFTEPPAQQQPPALYIHSLSRASGNITKNNSGSDLASSTSSQQDSSFWHQSLKGLIQHQSQKGLQPCHSQLHSFWHPLRHPQSSTTTSTRNSDYACTST
jgi:hypothetical protein